MHSNIGVTDFDYSPVWCLIKQDLKTDAITVFIGHGEGQKGIGPPFLLISVAEETGSSGTGWSMGGGGAVRRVEVQESVIIRKGSLSVYNWSFRAASTSTERAASTSAKRHKAERVQAHLISQGFY